MSLVEYQPSPNTWTTPDGVSSGTSERIPNIVQTYSQKAIKIHAGGTGSVRVAHPLVLAGVNVRPKYSYAMLSPYERIKYNLRRNKLEFVISVIAAITSLYIAGRAAFELSGVISTFLSISASAQEVGHPHSIFVSTRDSFDWFIGVLMAFVLIVSLLVSYGAKTESKINHAHELTRLVVGFAIGFLSGGAKPS